MGTKCQLACVMCSPHDSSGWIKDWRPDPRSQNKNLKATQGWDNKGQNPWSPHNWHKNNPCVFGENLWSRFPHVISCTLLAVKV